MGPAEMDAVLAAVLERAGWLEGRRVSVDRWLARLQGLGYATTGEVAQFLAEFGGLMLNPPGRCEGARFGIAEIVIDPARAEAMNQAEVEPLAEETGCDVFPIGWTDDHTTLYAGAGVLILDHPDVTVTVRASFREALAQLVCRQGDLHFNYYDNVEE